MQSICKKSGLRLQVIDDGFDATTYDCHPIFRLDKASIYALTKRTPVKTALQKRVVFLGLLSCTGLVDWQQAFLPSDEEIERGYPMLLQLHSILNEDKARRLPRLRIQPDIDICQIITDWNKLVRGFGIDAPASNADIELALKEQWHKSGGKLSAKLADWALDCLEKWEASDSLIGMYKRLLNTKLATVSMNDAHSLETLAEALQEYLPSNEKTKHSEFLVRRHVQNLLDEATRQRAAFLDKKVRKEAVEIAGVSSYKLVEISDSEAIKQEQEFNEPAPKAEDFKNSIDFMRATAQWKAKRFAHSANR